MVHRNSGAVVWDVRGERILCAALDDESELSKPTCVCWVGDRANCFAVGYDDGSVLLWGVPAESLQGEWMGRWRWCPVVVCDGMDAMMMRPCRAAAVPLPPLPQEQQVTCRAGWGSSCCCRPRQATARLYRHAKVPWMPAAACRRAPCHVQCRMQMTRCTRSRPRTLRC